MIYIGAYVIIYKDMCVSAKAFGLNADKEFRSGFPLEKIRCFERILKGNILWNYGIPRTTAAT